MTQVGCSFLSNAIAVTNLEDRAALITNHDCLLQLNEMIESRPITLVSAISTIDEAVLLFNRAFDPNHQTLFLTLAVVVIVQCVTASSASVVESTFVVECAQPLKNSSK
jgi:hypothetical protein